MRKYGRDSFEQRECWVCGEKMKTREEVDFFIPGDYTGCCKKHHLKDILSIKSDIKHVTGRINEMLTDKGSHRSTANCKYIRFKEKIIIKTPNKMRRYLINAFIFVAGVEILIHLPHLINLLINKLK
jgi:hypothetical protein